MKKLTNELLEELLTECRPYSRDGTVVKDIPGQGTIDQNKLGVCIINMDNEVFSAGDTDMKFTLQSASKIISLMMALDDFGKDEVFQNVGMEPMGDFYNSISHLESHDVTKPFNPMVNAGAIAVPAMIKGKDLEDKFSRILKRLRQITNNNSIKMNEEVYESEKLKGDRNRSLSYFMKSTGAIAHDIDETLDLYFRINSIDVHTTDLAKLGAFFANGGRLLKTGEQIIPMEHINTIEAIMMTSGMYNEAGKYAVEVGFPIKSGVSGCIIGSVPGRCGIGIIGPAINEKGNSTAGGALLQRISRNLELNIFSVIRNV
ncbi:glutaminase A [Alkalihalobacillus sp. TS-13]|uniref:glutaminase A n=1 Tax=Alkalihalobacillus sp. TS-13 TaxID=2842455 RepID=UPI001C866E0F|nr:glutaminase A [Alkalihalobacillus sp. TS-13]